LSMNVCHFPLSNQKSSCHSDSHFIKWYLVMPAWGTSSRVA
jgi:hypothetical protein